MKKEYDFTDGVRGKFYRKNAKLHIPVYLNSDNYSFVSKIAKKKNADISDIVNQQSQSELRCDRVA